MWDETTKPDHQTMSDLLACLEVERELQGFESLSWLKDANMEALRALYSVEE